MLPSKASEGDFIEDGLVSEDFLLSEFLFRQGMIVPNHLKGAPRSLSEEHTHVRLVKWGTPRR